MSGIHFADGFDGPDTVAFGLAAPQLLVVVTGALLAYVLVHAPLPLPVTAPMATLVVLLAAALGWGRLAGRPLLAWVHLVIRFTIRPAWRQVVGVGYEMVPAAVERPRTQLRRMAGEGSDQGHRDDENRRPAGNQQGGSHGNGRSPQGRAPARPDEPPWAQWLRQPTPSAEKHLPPEDDVVDPREPEPETTGCLMDIAVEAVTATLVPSPDPHTPPDRRPTPPGPGDAGTPTPNPTRLLDGVRRLFPGSGGRRPERVQPTATTGSYPPDRTRLVLIPEPVTPSGTRAEAHQPPENGDESDADVVDLAVLPLPLGRQHAAVLDVAEEPPAISDVATPYRDPENAPVFLGGARRITFFSLNGGAGRTTLATEVGGLLAARGRVRAAPLMAPERLRVALVDLDLRSANVAVRLGIPQPTLWDYLWAPLDGSAQLDRYLVSHPSGLQALLGSPKPVGPGGIEAARSRVAEIVGDLERAGCHVVIIDISSDLNAVTTWALETAHDIYVVITPTASGVQDAYRSTEVLRRLGARHKIRYVVNRARTKVQLDEVMADLGGRISVIVPYDPRLEDAENAHRLACLDGSGPAAGAITRLAMEIFPALQTEAPPSRRWVLGRHRGH